jgi:transposase
LAYRWFCKLDLEDEIPHHSTFSANRLGRFRESDVLRHFFERVVWAAMAMMTRTQRNCESFGTWRCVI